MKILWLSENEIAGKIPRDFSQMRTEMAWICASDAEHYHIGELPNLKDNSYDVAIIILPKNEGMLQQMSIYNGFDLVGNLRRVAKKIGWMQEGPVHFFQDYQVSIQVWWYGVLSKMDFLMVHNENDAKYIKGLFDKSIFVNRSLMIEDALPKAGMMKKIEGRHEALIGGNFVSWYGSFDSYMIALEFETDIVAPTMGRMPKDESQVEGLNHIQYKTWHDWMITLSVCKYAVHLMPTHAAGTFALNAGFLGIPCIGYKGLDTQEILHSELSVDLRDLESARKLACRLKNDKDFYNHCSEDAMNAYKHYYTEEIWKNNFNKFLEEI